MTSVRGRAREDLSIPVAISYSGGASSEWLVEAVLHGEIRRPQHVAVFFADTGDEHEWTYEALDRTEARCAAEGIPFVRTRTHRPDTLSGAIMAATRGERARLDNPPFWTENPGGGRGKLRQQCTQVWKTRPLRAAQSAWLKSIGLPKRVESWIGFGLDEQHRAIKATARNEVQWVSLDYPAIWMRRTRAEQRDDLARWGVQAPLFSMCVECPFKNEERWRQTTPGDLAKALEIDEAIREGLVHVGVDEPAYLFDGLIPFSALLRGERRRVEPLSAIPGCDAGACFV